MARQPWDIVRGELPTSLAIDQSEMRPSDHPIPRYFFARVATRGENLASTCPFVTDQHFDRDDRPIFDRPLNLRCRPISPVTAEDLAWIDREVGQFGRSLADR